MKVKNYVKKMIVAGNTRMRLAISAALVMSFSLAETIPAFSQSNVEHRKISPVSQIDKSAHASTLAFVSVNVIPMAREVVLANQTVVITDELLSYLAHGVTTVLHLSGAMSGAPALLRNRAQIARGEMLGPTLYLSGPNVDGDPPIWRGVSVAVTTPEDARRVVAGQKRAGYQEPL